MSTKRDVEPARDSSAVVASSGSREQRAQGSDLGGEHYDVVFLHPDLGIGGAERAIVDAALALKQPQTSSSNTSTGPYSQMLLRRFSQSPTHRRTGSGVLAAPLNGDASFGAGGGQSQARYRVLVITGHHDPARCFDETRDGTLEVRVVGDFIPRSIFGPTPNLLPHRPCTLPFFHPFLYMATESV